MLAILWNNKVTYRSNYEDDYLEFKDKQLDFCTNKLREYMYCFIPEAHFYTEPQVWRITRVREIGKKGFYFHLMKPLSQGGKTYSLL